MVDGVDGVDLFAGRSVNGVSPHSHSTVRIAGCVHRVHRSLTARLELAQWTAWTVWTYWM